jgi:glycosyl hydrolase family 15
MTASRGARRRSRPARPLASRSGAGDRAGDRRRAHRGRPGPAVPDRGHRGRLHRRGGDVHDLLVLARLGADEIGEVARARALCEKLLSYASPLLLYAEEIDPGTGRHLGNFPQAFSHLALINAVVHLIQEDARIS